MMVVINVYRGRSLVRNQSENGKFSRLIPSAMSLRIRRGTGPLFAALLLLIFAAGAWVARAPLLRGAADLWLVSDPVTRADVAAVLGGGLETRPFVAAELYKKGLVNKVLVSQVVEGRSTKIGGIPGHSELNRRLLLTLGVPEDAIGNFGEANRSTRDEAAALRDWAEQHQVSQIVIPTEVFAARRVRWIFDREFVGRPVRLVIASFDGPGYTRTEWWKTEAGMIAFQNEILKYFYDRLKY